MPVSYLGEKGHGKIYYALHSVFFALFEFYSHENEPDDEPDESKYSAWAFTSLVFTSIVISVESILYKYFSVQMILYSGLDLPYFVLFGWSFPVWLAINLRIYIYNNNGFRIVNEFRSLPGNIKRIMQALGLSISIGALVGSFFLVWNSPSLSTVTGYDLDSSFRKGGTSITGQMEYP